MGADAGSVRPQSIPAARWIRRPQKTGLKKEYAMAEVTIGQVTEFFAQIKSKRMTKERLDQVLKESTRDPQERLCLTLLKQAQHIIPCLEIDKNGQNYLFAKLVGTFASLNKMKVARTLMSYIPHETVHYDLAQDRFIEQLSLHGKLEEASALAPHRDTAKTAFRWAIIVAASNGNPEVRRSALLKFEQAVGLLLLPNAAVAKARMGDLTYLRLVAEKNDWAGYSHEALLYNGIMAYLATKQLSPFCYELAFNFTNLFQKSDIHLEIARVSKTHEDFEKCRAIASSFDENAYYYRKVGYWAQIAAATGNKLDLEKSTLLFDEKKHIIQAGDYKSLMYELARAYVKCGDIKKAQSYAKECNDPFWQANILIGIAQTVLENP